ncbi:hypothetical protein AGMMS49992_20790 [Clostridia bacterium]|nr:hypothetical protein AGMMS49992_20790 [Clostridia bacterium]
MKRIRANTVWAMVLAIILIASQFLLAAPALADEVWYTRSGTKLREKASTTADAIITIKGGEQVAVVGRANGWSQVKYGSHSGYVRSDLLVQLTRSGYIPLEKGNDCPQVKNVQVALRDLGYFSGKCDGVFGQDTLDAVKAFQKRNSMTADGIAGGETQRVLYSASARAADGSTGVSSGSVTAVASAANAASAALSSSASSTLKKGVSSTEVLQMQQQLRLLGYIDFTPDGVFGSGTEKAVVAFQKAAGLAADGKVGSATLTKLYSAAAPKANTPAASAASNPNDAAAASLKKGDTGTSVKVMQTLLKKLGYITFNPDGVFGSGTEDAVIAFQQRNGLTADGKVGAATLSALNSSKAVAAASATGSAAVTLKSGDKGSEVTKMQQRLKSLGFITFNADGTFGSGTKTGVVAFQKANNLTADGIAGPGTLTLLYSASAKSAPIGGTSASGGVSSGVTSGPASSQVKLLHFFDDVKPKYRAGTIVSIYDPASGLSWKLRFMSLGRHADSEPLTATDTATMNKAFGNSTTWTPKAVWVKFPDGVWSMATMHNTPHLSSTIKDNNFSGHLCVHFLRDMDECSKNDPNYGVQNQKAIRAAWKALTGQVIN